jgi:plasmid stabilization system protein ParE
VDYTLRYTKKALNDLDKIIGRIAEGDDQGASRFGGSLLDHIDLLARFPRMGALIRKRRNVRKLSPQSNPDLLPHQRAQAFS